MRDQSVVDGGLGERVHRIVVALQLGEHEGLVEGEATGRSRSECCIAFGDCESVAYRFRSVPAALAILVGEAEVEQLLVAAGLLAICPAGRSLRTATVRLVKSVMPLAAS